MPTRGAMMGTGGVTAREALGLSGGGRSRRHVSYAECIDESWPLHVRVGGSIGTLRHSLHLGAINHYMDQRRRTRFVGGRSGIWGIRTNTIPFDAGIRPAPRASQRRGSALVLAGPRGTCLVGSLS